MITVKLYAKSAHKLEITKAHNFLILPSFYKPKYINIKKKYGDKWDGSDTYAWTWRVTIFWLCWRFDLTLRK